MWHDKVHYRFKGKAPKPVTCTASLGTFSASSTNRSREKAKAQALKYLIRRIDDKLWVCVTEARNIRAVLQHIKRYNLPKVKP